MGVKVKEEAVNVWKRARRQIKEKKVLTKFYEKYNKPGLTKVKGLLAKADTTSKFAGLLTKLVQKYPKSITKLDGGGGSGTDWLNDILTKKDNQDLRKETQNVMDK